MESEDGSQEIEDRMTEKQKNADRRKQTGEGKREKSKPLIELISLI